MEYSRINNAFLYSIWLYFAGLGSGLRLDRCAIYLLREPQIASKVASCVLLNGAVFLGTISLVSYVLQPTIKGILTASLSPTAAMHAAFLFEALFNALWLLPGYIVTFFLSNMWYGELAELTAIFSQREAQRKLAEASGVVTPTASHLVQASHEDPLVSLSRQVYHSLLFCVHFAVILVVAKVPYIGPFLNFVMLSWNYSLYCFDYKWSLHNVPLEHRIAVIEEGWAYFAGFGASMVMITVFFSFYVGAAIVGVIFPLFIMTAVEANPKEAYMKVKRHYEENEEKVPSVRIPIFKVAISITNCILWATTVASRLLGLASPSSTPKLRSKKIRAIGGGGGRDNGGCVRRKT